MSEIEQTGLEGGIVSPHESHLACALLLDTSGSMSGDPIRDLNEGVNRFIQQVSMDPEAKERVDLAIISFNSSATVVQEFTPIAESTHVTLPAGGGTSMGAAVKIAVEKVKERTRFYDKMGTPVHKPWIFMITDGEPTDSIEDAVQLVRAEESKGTHGKLKFWSLAVGAANTNTLGRFSQRVMKMNDLDFSTVFDWLADSMAYISVSKPEDNLTPEKLPPNTTPKGW